MARPLIKTRRNTDLTNSYSGPYVAERGDVLPSRILARQTESRIPVQEHNRRLRPGPEQPRPAGLSTPRHYADERRASRAARGANRGRDRNNPVWHRDVGQPANPVDPTTHRLFIALRLPEPAIDEIGTFINEMPTMAAGNVRWTPRENVHLTLLFLGDTPIELLLRLQEQIAEVAENTSPFVLKLGEAGAFPSFHSPKILWVGLDGEVRKLVQLQGRIEGSLKTIGFEPEHRPFNAHVTVGRTVRDLDRQYAGDVGFSWRRSVLPAERASVPVNEIQLLRSRFQDGGVAYESVFSATLA